VAFALLHAVLLALWPFAPLIAVGVWWNSNTIAHNFVHRPFFRSAALNRSFSAFLSLLLGIPQTLWRDRHLAHHAERPWRLRVCKNLVLETLFVLNLWAALAWFAPRFLLLAYFPGYLAGLGLCALQGHWEHATGAPISHYGRLYNLLCFNDGYHAEHHSAPATHWTLLPNVYVAGPESSPLPPLFRWFDQVRLLELLERVVLRSPLLQRFVIRVHRQALQSLLEQCSPIRTVTIVGGGLFPRTALILRELFPAAKLVIVDCNRRSLDTARTRLQVDIECRCERFLPGQSYDSDLTVIPLCFEGKRDLIYRNPPTPFVVVHDWIWSSRGQSSLVSALLLKRINLIRTDPFRINPIRFNPIQR